jgi:2-hydroxychromene-2-carboxylate isomerase
VAALPVRRFYKTFGQSPLDHPLKRKYVIEVDAPRMARRIGLELKMPANFTEHSLPPSRAFYWIEQQDPATAVAFGFAASDAAVAADAAASIGCDRDAVLVGMQDAPTKSRLIRENEEAIRNGVFGSPFFLMDGAVLGKRPHRAPSAAVIFSQAHKFRLD